MKTDRLSEIRERPSRIGVIKENIQERICDRDLHNGKPLTPEEWDIKYLLGQYAEVEARAAQQDAYIAKLEGAARGVYEKTDGVICMSCKETPVTYQHCWGCEINTLKQVMEGRDDKE